MTPKAAHIKDPFSRKIDGGIRDVAQGQTLHDLAKMFHGADDFDCPTICILNDKPVLRENWGYAPKEDDVVIFVTVVGNLLAIALIAVAAVAVVSLILALSVKTPSIGEIPEPDPVFTLRGQTNRIRLGDPIEDHYGRVRIWPSYAAVSYNKYIDNEQYLYSLFCIGQGSYDIEQTLIEDTDISNFDDVVHEYYEPNATVTLFRDNVNTNSEVADIELFGPNEPEYDDWVGPFAASPSGTSSDILEIDVVLPQGLYYSNDEGGLSSRTITAEFEYRQIDDAGAPVSSWATLHSFSKTLRTNTPQRYTFTQNVASGRYEVRARRTNNKNTDHRSANTIKWERLRAFLPSVGNYGNVTLLAIRARASNSLNDSSRSQVNLYATRKLPIHDGVQWNSPVATRSAVWAMVNLFRASYGANITDDALFDLDELRAIDAQLVTEGRSFDWSFASRSTVWESAETVCRAIRGKPMLNGSLITIILERPKSVPTAVFGPANILKGSFTWEIKLHNQDEHDGIEIEYIDPTTWKPEVIECYLPDSSGDFLEPIKLAGVTDRDWAYREGMYEEGKRKYHRENITFATGLEGYIPAWGDLIMVQHDVPNWGQGGRVLGIEGTDVFFLDTEVTFGVGTHQIYLKTKTGATVGPLEVVAGADSFRVQTTSPIPDQTVFNFNHPEKPVFLFGEVNLEGKLCTVVDLRSSGTEAVEVTCVNYDSRVFDYDTDNAVAIPTNPTPITLEPLPTVTGLVLTLNKDREVTISWNGILAAFSYVVQYSETVNFDDFDTVETENTTITLPTPYLPMYIRVAAVVDLGRGPWSTASYVAEDANVFTPIVPANVSVIAGYGSLQVNWDPQTGADGYELSITDADPDGGSPEPVNVDAESEINSILLAGLNDGQLKYFQVRAKKVILNDEGVPSLALYSAWSPAVNGTTNQVIGSNFYGTTPPPAGSGQVDGSIWFDTDDDFKIYVWDLALAQWVDAQYILTISELQGVIAANQIITNAANIADAVITSAKIANLDVGKLTSGDITAAILNLSGTGGVLKSNNFVEGSAGFRIRGDGTAEFSDVEIRGNLGSSSIVLDGVNSEIKSSNFVAGTSGWRIKGDGSVELESLIVRSPQIEDGAVSYNQTDNPSGSYTTTTEDTRLTVLTSSYHNGWLDRIANLLFIANITTSDAVNVYDVKFRVVRSDGKTIYQENSYTRYSETDEPIAVRVAVPDIPLLNTNMRYEVQMDWSIWSAGTGTKSISVSSRTLNVQQVQK